MRNMKISAKLILGFVIVSILTAFVGGFGAIMIIQTDTSYSNMLLNNNHALMSLADMRESFQKERVALRNIVIAASNEPTEVETRAKEYDEISAGVTQSMIEYEKSITDKSRETAFYTAQSAYEGAFTDAAQAIRAAALAGDAAAAVEGIKITAQAATPIGNGLAELVDLNDTFSNEISTELTNGSIMTSIILIIIAAVSMIIAILLGIFISAGISKPITKMVIAANNIAKGDMNVDAHYESKDEVGQLSLAFTSMIKSINAQVVAVTQLAEGDLTVDIHPRCPEDVMGVGLEKLVNSLNSMFSEINNATTQVSTGSKQIADGSQSLAQGSTEQAAAVEQLSSSISEIAEKTKENAHKADTAANLSNSIKHNAQKGSEQMNNMMQAVREINEASQSINKVIKVIDDIAFQTNILALNAAVEAARAGQHGKGFAVVAEEVRNLAAKSAAAAKDTGSLIANSMEKAQLGAKIAADTSASLEEIVTGINESTEIVGDIAKSSEEQSLAIMQINKGIDQVAQVVQQNSATAEESAAASEEMSSQSNMLSDLVSQYKLKGGNTSRPAIAKSAPKQLSMPSKTSYSQDGFGKY